MHIDDFIQRIERLETRADATLDQRRRDYETLHLRHRPRDPYLMRIDDAHVAGVPVRRFTPSDANGECVVYLHGGGWNLGSARSHHGITANLAARLGREVISVDYSLLPEADYEEALSDCRGVIDRVQPTAVVGDSAGGRLAIDIAYTSDWRGVLGLIYPVIGRPTAETLGEDAPLLSRDDVLELYRMAAPTMPETDPDRPPTRSIEVLAVARDPLTRALERAVDTWRQAGASVGYRCAPEMVHAALHAHAELPAMQSAWQAFCQALDQRLDQRH